MRKTTPNAGVVELADALDSKSCGSDTVWVRFPPPAPKILTHWSKYFFFRREINILKKTPSGVFFYFSFFSLGMMSSLITPMISETRVKASQITPAIENTL